jgi:hypothetical protein
MSTKKSRALYIFEVKYLPSNLKNKGNAKKVQTAKNHHLKKSKPQIGSLIVSNCMLVGLVTTFS